MFCVKVYSEGNHGVSNWKSSNQILCLPLTPFASHFVLDILKTETRWFKRSHMQKPVNRPESRTLFIASIRSIVHSGKSIICTQSISNCEMVNTLLLQICNQNSSPLDTRTVAGCHMWHGIICRKKTTLDNGICAFIAQERECCLSVKSANFAVWPKRSPIKCFSLR